MKLTDIIRENKTPIVQKATSFSDIVKIIVEKYKTVDVDKVPAPKAGYSRDVLDPLSTDPLGGQPKAQMTYQDTKIPKGEKGYKKQKYTKKKSDYWDFQSDKSAPAGMSFKDWKAGKHKALVPVGNNLPAVTEPKQTKNLPAITTKNLPAKTGALTKFTPQVKTGTAVSTPNAKKGPEIKDAEWWDVTDAEQKPKELESPSDPMGKLKPPKVDKPDKKNVDWDLADMNVPDPYVSLKYAQTTSPEYNLGNQVAKWLGPDNDKEAAKVESRNLSLKDVLRNG